MAILKKRDFIENKEFGTRGLYMAHRLGYIDVYDDCEFIVAIRSILKEQQATYWMWHC